MPKGFDLVAKMLLLVENHVFLFVVHLISIDSHKFP